MRCPEYPISRFPDAQAEINVAEIDGEVAGMVGLEDVGKGAAEVRRMYVAAEFRRRGLGRKLLRFVTEVKSGAEEVAAPVYSHVSYDIVKGQFHMVRQPDILIVEGLNVLQTGSRLMVSDLFDFSIYVDARIEDIEAWYVKRFLALRKTSFANPEAHFHHYANLSDEHARIAAEDLWHSINLPNLVDNILPTRPRATMVLRKDNDHGNKILLLRRW